MKVFCEKCGVNRVESGLCGACLPEVRVGDTVASFDFACRSMVEAEACYVVGVVEAVGRRFDGVQLEVTCDRYKIRVVRQVFGGREVELPEGGHYVFPPVNGVQVLGPCGPKVTGAVVVLMRG